MTALDPEPTERMDYDPDDPQTWDAPWTIDTDGMADWAARKLAAARQERDRLQRRHDEEVAAAKQWLDREMRKPERDIAFFEHHLIEYHRSKRPDGGRYPLRHGVLTSRKGSTVVEVTDEQVFVEWAEGNQRLDLLRIAVAPAKDALKRLPTRDGRIVDDSGEVVPGVEVVERDRSWKVETTADEQPAWLPVPDVSEGEAA